MAMSTPSLPVSPFTEARTSSLFGYHEIGAEPEGYLSPWFLANDSQHGCAGVFCKLYDALTYSSGTEDEDVVPIADPRSSSDGMDGGDDGVHDHRSLRKFHLLRQENQVPRGCLEVLRVSAIETFPSAPGKFSQCVSMFVRQ